MFCFSDAEEYASQINAIFIETSALTAINVPDLFMKIGMVIHSWYLAAYFKGDK